MTKKKWILISGVVVLCLLICLCVVMCSPADRSATEPTGTTGTSSMTYTIEVKSESGLPLEEIGVYVYTDFKMEELVWFARTDAEGKLTFEDIASDNFVAVLAEVPAGYLAEAYYPLTGEHTQISLAVGLMEGDLNTITYELGDIMLDFSVTGPDGTVYTLSELLQQKKAVVLNFWYLQCEPCKSEFPYLQEAYEKYSDDVIVLAMNPVNTDEAEIAQFQEENGYTFPMVLCDPAWEKAMQLTAFPTTVVIDSFGNIALIHQGSITDAQTFETIFKYYSDDDYEQTISKDIEEVEEAAGVERTVGTADNPFEMGVASSFDVTVAPGELVYYNIYKMTTTLYLSIRNENAYVIYNGQTYYPSGGTVSLPVTAEDTSTALELVFGNSGSETQTYTVTMNSAAGSMGNPYAMKLGEFTAKVPAGSTQGIFYTYTPDKDGILTLEVKSVTSGVRYGISLTTMTRSGGSVQNNMDADGSTNKETGNKTVSIKVYNGIKVDINVATLPDSSNTYPAANFVLVATLTEGTGVEEETVKTITYSINVTDQNRNPVSNVDLNLVTADGKKVTLTTNEKGVASSKREVGTYPVTLNVPNGYSANTTEFKLTEQIPSISIKLDKVITENYTVTVVDEEGRVVSEAYVTIDDRYAQTDASGKAVLSLVKGTYTAKAAKSGYIAEEATFAEGSKELTIVLKKGVEDSAIEYKVTLVDYYGRPVSGATVTFLQNGAALASGTSSSGGEVTAMLAAGDYTVDLPDTYSGSSYLKYSYDASKAVLSQETSTIALTVLNRLDLTESNEKELSIGEEKCNSYYLDTENVESVTHVELKDGINYVLFDPADSPGLYQITASNAELSYWSSPFFVQHVATETEDVKFPSGNSITFNHKSTYGSTYVIGITGSADTVLVVTRIGEPILNDSDLESIPYGTNAKPTKVQSTPAANGKTLHYVDVTEMGSSKYTISTNPKGIYYIYVTENGTTTQYKVYVHLGPDAPYLSLSNFIGFTDKYAANSFYQYVRDEDGTALYKEDYAELLYAYAQCMDPETQLYPLTKDLLYMIQNGGDNKGWWDPEDPDYIFYTTDENGERVKIDVNPEYAQMFAFCWYQ